MLWYLCGFFILIIVVLILKISLLRRAADEIRAEFMEKLSTDTYTLISVTSRDRHMCRLAAEINTQLRLLRSERCRFQSGSTELSEAITNISHDLRTPLTAIFGYLELLEREEKSEPVHRYLSMIENRSLALARLMDELFRYSVIRTEVANAHREAVVLGSALEESLSAYYAALKSRGISPKISIPSQQIRRRLDPNALSRIFGNIISNAIKYSDGDLSVVLKESGEIVFSNMAKSLTPVTTGRLFDRFYTVETGGGSVGLGLSIAKLLTTQMGGEIFADYADGALHISISFPEICP